MAFCSDFTFLNPSQHFCQTPIKLYCDHKDLWVTDYTIEENIYTPGHRPGRDSKMITILVKHPEDTRILFKQFYKEHLHLELSNLQNLKKLRFKKAYNAIGYKYGFAELNKLKRFPRKSPSETYIHNYNTVNLKIANRPVKVTDIHLESWWKVGSPDSLHMKISALSFPD